jgi:hypothetical protein
MNKGFKEDFLKHLSKFNEKDKELFDRIYWVQENRGELNPPREMISWIESQFGDLEKVKNQDFLRITDLITYEGAIFNEIRTMRPILGESNFEVILKAIEDAKDGPFSHPEIGTPEDVFGRIKGEYCMTGSNIAKYDGLHGIIISNSHDPLLLSRRRVTDYMEVAHKWFEKAHKYRSEAVYPLFTWSCLWKAGASVVHGHSQVVLAEGQAYSKVEELRALSLKYQEQYKRSYFDDVYEIHHKLNLALEKDGVKIITKITPVKEKEMMIIAPTADRNFYHVLSDVLNTMKERLGVASFNVAVIFPPLEDTKEVWSHVPVIARIVDRGKLNDKTVDVGPMELYAQSIIGSNPYTVFGEIKKSLKKD